MALTIEQKRESLTKAYQKINYSLDTEVTYWGNKISLCEAIKTMDSDDIKDGRRTIKDWKDTLSFAKTVGVPAPELKSVEAFDTIKLGEILSKDLKTYENNRTKLKYDYEWDWLYSATREYEYSKRKK